MLRSLITSNVPLVAPFAWDPLTARLAEMAGAKVVFMSGFAVCTSLGVPDNGILTEQEMVRTAAKITKVIDAPLIVDADDGYGGVECIERTIADFERAGVAGIQIEDQPFPKRSGLLAGKSVLPLDDAVAKISAAVKARLDPQLIIIGRTDAVESLGMDAAIDRARAFYEAGCDLVLITELPGASGLNRYASELRGIPKVYLGPPLDLNDQQKLGVNLQLQSGAMRPTWLTYYNTVCRQLDSHLEIENTEISALISRATRLQLYEDFLQK